MWALENAARHGRPPPFGVAFDRLCGQEKKEMLTLTRKPEESIVIGEGDSRIEVTVKEIRRNQVRIGIQAPENVRIFRKELYEKGSGSDENTADGQE